MNGAQLLLRRAGGAFRLWDGDVDWLGRAHANRVETGFDLGAVADDENGQLVGVDVFLRSCGDVGKRDILKARLVGIEKVGGVAVELEPFAFGQDLVLGDVAEEERREDVVFGALQLFVSERL